MQHVRTLDDLSPADVQEIFQRASELKQKLHRGERPALLAGRTLALLFEKPSLRTRVSFEAATNQLGGAVSFLTTREAGLDGREALCDVARVLGSYCDALALRTFSQQLIDDFASVVRCPVINALSDERHPCQALTDLFTLREVFGDELDGRLVFIGDGNNVARSLALACAMLKVPFTFCSPPGYALDEEFVRSIRQRHPAADIQLQSDPHAAVREAAVVYTDVWASMGQEAQAEERKRAFAGFQINEALMADAPPDCRFMHDLPARRGLEVTDAVIDGPQSIVFQQAENRMHLAKGLLVWLLES